MRHRWACWAAVLMVVAGHRAMTQAPAATATEARPDGAGVTPAAGPGIILPGRLARAAALPDLPDLALYLQVRGMAAAGDAEHAAGLARVLLERYPDSIWSGRTYLDVGRVRRRTGAL